MRAADFYALADSQIVMGPSCRPSSRSLTPDCPCALLMYAEGPVDTARVARVAATAFARVARYFGVVPFGHYTILQELLTPLSPRHGYNFSMEHLDSMTSTLAVDRALTARSTDSDDIRFQFNLAHHIAHAWVPKRASGAGYFPFQWELAPLIDTIWFAEGFGQYAAIMAVAAGEADPAAYRERLLERRFRQSIADAPPFLRRLGLVDLSRVASTRYSSDFRTGQLVFSRGGLLAAAIDDRIKAETGGARSLRDVLTAMLKDFGPASRGFAVEQFRASSTRPPASTSRRSTTPRSSRSIRNPRSSIRNPNPQSAIPTIRNPRPEQRYCYGCTASTSSRPSPAASRRRSSSATSRSGSGSRRSSATCWPASWSDRTRPGFVADRAWPSSSPRSASSC